MRISASKYPFKFHSGIIAGETTAAKINAKAEGVFICLYFTKKERKQNGYKLSDLFLQ